MSALTLAAQFGHRLALARVHAGYTQVEFAQRLGVTRSAVGFWENGERFPRLPQLYALAAALHCSVADLLPEHDDRFTRDESVENR